MDGPLAPGELLGERYRIGELLGRGGMGLVYAAHDLRTGGEVALKLLRPELRERTRTVSRFEREARALLRLSSPHVVRVTEVAVLPDGTTFLVMERLHGRSLARELDLRGVLPRAEAIQYLMQAAQGTQAAHEQDIVHRDLKPENLFLVDGAGGRSVKVLDFGISKLDSAAAFRVTETDTSLGTPAYMSPEQLRSAKYVDARSDVWSLGVIGYELLTGRLPFDGTDSAAIARAILRAVPRPIGELSPDVPRELAAAVERALHKDPGERPRSAALFARSLESFAAPGSPVELGMLAHASGPERTFSDAPERGDTHRDTPVPVRRAEPSAFSRSSLLRLALLGGVLGVLLRLALHYFGQKVPF